MGTVGYDSRHTYREGAPQWLALTGCGRWPPVGLALVAAQGSVAGADTTPVATVLRQQIGRPMTMNNRYVSSVPADEGFWVDSDHGRMWVQIDTARSRPTTSMRGTR